MKQISFISLLAKQDATEILRLIRVVEEDLASLRLRIEIILEKGDN